MRRLLFTARTHRIDDPRLLHRQMRLLHRQHPDLEFWFLDTAFKPRTAPRIDVTPRRIDGIPVNQLTLTLSPPSPFGFKAQFAPAGPRRLAQFVAQFLGDRFIHFLQVSDVREIRFGLQLGKQLGSALIYDAHEDYVRQALDFKTGPRKYLWAFAAYLLERRYLRHFHHIFCTDEYLLQKYRRPAFRAPPVHLLRNFPPRHVTPATPRTYPDRDHLRLVYIGGVNPHRGVVETARYIERYNHEAGSQKLSFTVYGPGNDLLQQLVANHGVQHIPWLDYAELMPALRQYDAGVCLWLPIKKFHRNLPLKNFDYMSQGLPVITSNFGNLLRYIDRSGAGIAIDPRSYHAFAAAVTPLFRGSVRQQFGQNGIDWVQREGNFEQEGQTYAALFAPPAVQS